MRVLHVNTAARTGGAAQVAHALFEAQRARGAAADFFSGRPEAGTDEAGPEGAGTEDAAVMSPLRFRANVLAYRAASVEAPFERARWARLLPPRLDACDVVHLHNAHGYYLPDAALAALLDRPCVWTLHDLWLATGRCAAPQGCTRWETGCAPCPHPGHSPASRFDRSGPEQARRRVLMRAGRTVFAVPSRWLADRMIGAGLPGDRLHVVPNPLLAAAPAFDAAARRAARERSGWPVDRCVALVAAGALADPNKNVATVLAAMAGVARPERWCLVLLGRPDRAMRRRIEALPVRTVLVEQGLDRAALAEAYLAADLFLNPSRGESFGMTNLEALAHGCRLLCSDLPVFREVAGEAATYLPPDVPASWTAALDAARDAALAQEPAAPDMALAADLRRRHALDTIVDAYQALYGLARD